MTRKIARTGKGGTAQPVGDSMDESYVCDETLINEHKPLKPGEISLDDYSICVPLQQSQFLSPDDSLSLGGDLLSDESSPSPSLCDVFSTEPSKDCAG